MYEVKVDRFQSNLRYRAQHIAYGYLKKVIANLFQAVVDSIGRISKTIFRGDKEV